MSAVAYDDVSLDRSAGWCEKCCRKYLLPAISEQDEDELFSAGILGLAQDLMMSISGAADPIEPARAKRMKAYLEFRLMTWRPSTLHKAYDDAARARVLAVLEALDAVEVTHG